MKVRHLWLVALLVPLGLCCANDSDLSPGRLVVHATYGSTVTCTAATGDGSVCAEADVEANDDMYVGDDLTVVGLATVGETLGVTGVGTFSSSVGIVSQTIGVDFNSLRVFDNPAALLPAAAANDDIGLIIGTPGTDAPSLQTADEGGSSAEQHHYAVFYWVVPPTYVSGSTVTLKVHGGMLRVADQASTTVVDVEAWVTDYTSGDLSVSTDLCGTAAITAINATTFAEHSFVIDDDLTGHVLTAGSMVVFKLRMTVDDNEDAGNDITMVIDRINIVIST